MKRIYTDRDHIVYKKAFVDERGVVVVMRIVKGTEVNFPIDDHDGKNRTVRVKVLEIRTTRNQPTKFKEATSGWSNSFLYPVGKVVIEGDRLSQLGADCWKGIHFFRDFTRAARW